MGRRLLIYISVFILGKISAQATFTELKVGDKAPSFVLNMAGNSIHSYNMPYLNRYVLMHFWSSSVKGSRVENKHLNRVAGRYNNALYRSMEGFEIIAVAVQSDKTAWNNSIKEDTLTNFMNGIAVRGYNEDVCKKFGITKVPTDILIDNEGTVIAINPRIRALEDILDEKKNFQPVKKDVIGTLALSSNPSDFLKFGKVYLFDGYGDSITRSTTNDKGAFVFSEVKLNQDFILKVDNKSDIVTSDPLALYSYKGEKILDGKTMEQGFVFYIPSKVSYKLTEGDHSTVGNVNLTKELQFRNNGAELTPKDEQDIASVSSILMKNKSLSVEIAAHTDSKLDDKGAMDLTMKQCNTIKNFLLKKGIAPNRIRMSPQGRTSPKKKCQGPCTEEDHKANRRVEFLVYKS